MNSVIKLDLVHSSRCWWRNLLLLVSTLFLAACQSLPSPEHQSSAAIEANTSVETPVTAPVIETTTAVQPEPIEQGRTQADLWQRIRSGFALQHYYDNAAVQQAILQYRDEQQFFDQISERAEPFLYWIVNEVERRNLPLEIVLVPVIESAFNPAAYSREHAVGMWQFVRATGRSFGLNDDWWYDGRRDPLAATSAALDYLEQLNKRFDGDWLLTLAAYNTGAGNISRAIRRNQRANKSTEFWDLPIATETKRHVPRILAISAIVADNKAFGIELLAIANQPYFAVVDIEAQIDINLAASLAGIQPQTLKQLNPGYLQWATHPDSPQNLVLPLASVNQFQAELASLDRDRWVTWDRYQIRAGDSLSGIARKLGTRVDILRTVNGLRGSRIIAGRSLLVPRTNDLSLLASTAFPVSRSTSAAVIPRTYTVRRGDNLWSIAGRYGLRSSEIAQLNQIDIESLLQPGQKLKLISATIAASTEVGASALDVQDHKVVRGDSLDRIAKRYELSVDQLLKLNNLEVDSVIYPGQSIKLQPKE